MPHADREIQKFRIRPSYGALPASAACCLMYVYLAFDHDNTDESTHVHPLDVHTLAEMRSRRLATWQPQVERAPRARCSISECHQGRGAAWTTRSRPPRGFGASSAAHAEPVSTAKCCVGRGGVGAHQRTATRHHSTASRSREILPRRPSVASSRASVPQSRRFMGPNRPSTWPAWANWERRVGPGEPTSWPWRTN